MSASPGEPSLVTAFLAGYAPQEAGLYFNGLELLAQAARAAGGALAAQVGEERERVVGQHDRALARVEETAFHLTTLGATPAPGPEDATAYAAWAEAVFDTARSVMVPGSAPAVAHLLGYVLGEAVATLDVLAILSRLRVHDADHLWMRLQADSLERERATAERRLARLAAHPLVPEAAQVATALAAHAVAAAAPSGSHAGRAAQAESSAAEVATHAAAVEAALAAGPGATFSAGGD